MKKKIRKMKDVPYQRDCDTILYCLVRYKIHAYIVIYYTVFLNIMIKATIISNNISIFL